MTRINIFLLLLVLFSAMYVVRTQYESRVLYTALHRANAEARRLETEHERLQVEKRAQATPSRVEALARDKLQMRTATPSLTQYVQDPAPIVAVPAQGDTTSSKAKP